MRLRLAPFDKVALAEALGFAPAALSAAQAWQEPVLVTSLVSGGGAVLGALQRRELFGGRPLVRLSSGPRATIAGLALHHVFAVPSLKMLAPDATPRTLLNRYVRGFLRGYTKLGVPAQYLGREYFSLARRPCGLVGYELTASGALLLEAFVGLDAPVLEPSGDGRQRPIALVEMLRRSDPVAFAASIHEGFAAKWQLEASPCSLQPERLPPARDGSGDFVRRRVPIGWVEASAALVGESASVRIAGDLLCARSAIEAVESRAAAALLAGRGVDESVVAPLADGPLDGATADDVRLVVQDAFDVRASTP